MNTTENYIHPSRAQEALLIAAQPYGFSRKRVRWANETLANFIIQEKLICPSYEEIYYYCESED